VANLDKHMHVRRTGEDHDVPSSLLHIETKGHIFSMCCQPKRPRAGFGGARGWEDAEIDGLVLLLSSTNEA
jgi:hypothetical protein